MNRRQYLSAFLIAVASLATATFVSCYQNTSFYQYHSTDIKGWERSDFLEYHVSPVSQKGYYVEEIGIRTATTFPYRNLSLVVNQHVVSTTGQQTGRFRSDTVVVDIFDENGRLLGQGANLKQYVIPFKSLKLEVGDSLSIRIHHNMKSIAVPGVSDVGVKLTYQYAE